MVALILAGGESKRMNSPKMLLPFNGKTIIEKVIDNVVSSSVNQTIVVVGAYNDKIVEKIRDYPITYCYNANYKKGMITSVKCGFRSVPSVCEAVLVFLGDQPLIPPEIPDRLISTYRLQKKGIVIPVYDSRRGHPILISNKYRDEIEKLDENEGLRMLPIKFPDDILEVEINDDSILRDIDTQEDYKNEIDQNH